MDHRTRRRFFYGRREVQSVRIYGRQRSVFHAGTERAGRYAAVYAGGHAGWRTIGLRDFFGRQPDRACAGHVWRYLLLFHTVFSSVCRSGASLHLGRACRCENMGFEDTVPDLDRQIWKRHVSAFLIRLHLYQHLFESLCKRSLHFRRLGGISAGSGQSAGRERIFV